MKLWNKRFSERDEFPFLEEFNSSIKLDKFLYRAEIEASKAYAEALYKALILTQKECRKILSGLDKVKGRIGEREVLSP